MVPRLYSRQANRLNVVGLNRYAMPRLIPIGRQIKLSLLLRIALEHRSVVYCLLRHRLLTTRLYGQASRAISTGQLNASQRFHTLPINVVVFDKPLETLRSGRSNLEGGFPLRCFQRLSLPYLATWQCHWRDNQYTRGTSTPVLSY